MTTPLDPAALRHSFGQFATGICVIGTTDRAGVRHGATVNSFTSVSLEPALLLVCLGHFMRSHDAFADSKGFGVSVLSHDQEAVARHFASKSDQKWPDDSFQSGTSGGLLLPRALARFDCVTHNVIKQGDHTLLIGRPLAVDHAEDCRPLIYFRGAFDRLPT